MKKSIKKLGVELTKANQLQINGGKSELCYTNSDCPGNMGCCKNGPYYGTCFEGEDYRRLCTY
ncbi:hypothetical protein [Tenacibaculum geojense]|uniref:Uncharacterized protein n=1 Tax=Tenacibaculum geojense TaxID=915352 RepID=A0ABW3JNU6_9FLAO